MEMPKGWEEIKEFVIECEAGARGASSSSKDIAGGHYRNNGKTLVKALRYLIVQNNLMKEMAEALKYAENELLPKELTFEPTPIELVLKKFKEWK